MCPDKLNVTNNTCECSERVGTSINSYHLFLEIKEFFEKNVALGIYADIPVEKPHYIGSSNNEYRQA